MGAISFQFNSLEKKIKKDFFNNAPSYRIVASGLNLEAKCATNNCVAFGKKVWIQKGFGQFNIGK